MVKSSSDSGGKPPSERKRRDTASLLGRARDGDASAQNQLAERYWAPLKEWGHGRLPRTARERADTEDLVQVTLLKTLKRLGTFEPRRKGAFTAFLHQVLMNQIRDEIRRSRRRPVEEELAENLRDPGPSPQDESMEKEFLADYEAALRRLPEQQQRAIVLRIELGHTHEEIAKALECPSANAARMLVSRALARLAALLDERER